MQKHNLLLCLASIIVAAGLSGCGDGRPDRAAVCGTVLFQGKPVDGAEVVFTPEAGRKAMGCTDNQGRFELFTFEPSDGAIVGRHVVTICKKVEMNPGSTANPYAPTRDALPSRYGNGKQTDLSADVKAGVKNDFTFDLQL